MPYIEKLTALCDKYKCEIKLDESLSSYTTFRIGGRCSALVKVNSTDSLRAILSFLRSENINYFIIGRGSNIIVSDDGFNGVIIKIGKEFSKINLISKNEIYCTAGSSLNDVCQFALENSLEGLEFAYGIPGTSGGALFMNAGAYGGEIKDVIKSAQYIDSKNNLVKIEPSDMSLSYRHSVFAENREYTIVDMIFKLNAGKYENIKNKMIELMEKRRSKQPLEYPSAGSTFKRPEGSFASLLIEQCGLKGTSVGGAKVSEKHSGFVINTGDASCKDVLELTEKVSKIVFDKTGYKLELEPLILK